MGSILVFDQLSVHCSMPAENQSRKCVSDHSDHQQCMEKLHNCILMTAMDHNHHQKHCDGQSFAVSGFHCCRLSSTHSSYCLLVSVDEQPLHLSVNAAAEMPPQLLVHQDVAVHTNPMVSAFLLHNCKQRNQMTLFYIHKKMHTF